jgi:WhiB family redox-sensing transcriptional regulator
MTSGSLQVTTGLAAGWRARAACTGQQSALFFPRDEADERAIRRAREICAACAVSEACLEFALETNQRAGIWGGTTEVERRSLRRRWLATRRAG